jgi:hypothetical protein
MTSKKITIEDVQAYCKLHFPLFMESDTFFGETFFQIGNYFFSFERFADFLRDEGFAKDDKILIQKTADYILRLLKEGDDAVQNGVYVSFIEGLVDRSYKYPHLKDFIRQMPEEVITFIQGFFIEEVLLTLGLKSEKTKENP